MASSVSATREQAWRVLVAGADAAAREAVAGQLASGWGAGFDCSEAADVAAALRMLDGACGGHAAIDCVLLLEPLSGMDTPAALRLLAGGDGLARVCAVVLCAGEHGAQAERELLRAGAQDCVSRAAGPAALPRSVGMALERWRLLRAAALERERMAAQAAEREAHLRLALEASATGLWTWDVDTDAVSWSDECFRIHGLAPGGFDHTGAGFFQLVHPEDRERVRRTVHEAIAARALYECEFRILHPRGEVAWVGNRGRGLHDAQGRLLRVLGTITDISRRKHAEAAQARSAAFAHSVVESSADCIKGLSADGRLLWMNGNGRGLMEVPPGAEVQGRDWLAFWEPGGVRAEAEAALAAARGGGVGRFRGPCPTMAGTPRWWDVVVTPIPGPEGPLEQLLCVSRDVTEARTVEATLRERELELQTLADNSPDILTRFDRALRHVFVNVAVERATGRPRDDFLGRTNRELGMPARDCKVWDAVLQAVFDMGQPGELDFAFDGPQGLRHYSARFVPEPGADGEVEFVLGVTRDVTGHRQAEEALKEADRQKDEFLATLAHELRNPLAPIRNGLEILRRDPALQGAGAQARDMMARQFAHLVRLVDDLLDVSRISRGKMDLRRERVRVQAVLEHALEASRPLVEAGGHALVLELCGEPLWVDGDLTRLAQVVSNLLNNAAKYTAAGGRIALRLAVEPAGGAAHAAPDTPAQVVLSVRDNGSGIAADMLPRVFDLFAQADGTRHRAQGGLGIGLSLAHRLLEMHGGCISAESPGLGQGSTFTLRLPLAARGAAAVESTLASNLNSTVEAAAEALVKARQPGEAAEAAQAEPSGLHCLGRRVLVVDDNVDAADSLAMMLELMGHEARAVHDGAAALQAAPAWRPDIVLLDIGLPGLNGYEVARRLRADPALAGTLLVALTGWGSEGDKRRSAEAGFDAHLTKPVALGDVEAVLARFAPPPALTPSAAASSS